MPGALYSQGPTAPSPLMAQPTPEQLKALLLQMRLGLYPSVNRVNGALTPNPNQRPLNPPVIGARG
jgi:hypothetical protein